MRPSSSSAVTTTGLPLSDSLNSNVVRSSASKNVNSFIEIPVCGRTLTVARAAGLVNGFAARNIDVWSA